MNIDENSRLGAVLFYAYYTKRQNNGKSEDMFKTFCDIPYHKYDEMYLWNRILAGVDYGELRER